MAPLRARLRVGQRAWRRSRLVRPILTLVGGTAAAQAAVFAARPLLTRLYTPEDFGVLTVFTTLLALGTTVAAGGYRSAILLPRQDDRAAGLTALALILAAASSLLAMAGVAASLPFVRDPVVVAALWLLPLALLAADASMTLDKWHTRFDRFGLVSRLRIVQSGVVVAVQLGVGVLGAHALGLVGGAALGFVAVALAGGFVVLRRDRARFAPLDRSLLGRLAGRYRRFPRFSAPAALLNIAATRAPVLLLAVFFGSAVVGQFGVAYGTLALPLGLLTGSVGHVFFVRAAEARRSGDLHALARSVLRGLWLATLFPSLAVLVAGPSLFAFVFGDVWAEAGRFAQLTAPWVLLASVAAPLTSLFDILERQRADLAFSVVMFVVLAATITVASAMLNATGAVLAAGIAGAALRLAHLGWMLKLAQVSLGGVFADAMRALLAALPWLVLVALLDRSAWSTAWTLAATVVGTLACLILAARATRQHERDASA